MKCPITECSSHQECSILDIIKKVPKDGNSCSYFKRQRQQEKKAQKMKGLEEEVIKKRKFKKQS